MAGSEFPSLQVPCPCQIRARRARRSLQFAPQPPPELTGRLAYGFAIEPSTAKKVIQRYAGERKLHDFQKYALFETVCREAISPRSKRGFPTFETYRNHDSDGTSLSDEILTDFIITVATNDSTVLPSKEELDRLKAFLETDAEPQWYEM
ncbi:hypothetical protein SCHPADRAFT_907956 [Schizopora paradoxa]|uniref:Uncharacterized protein n=1 Tax=Schizopora paradoxa TaxID=27342 RepID=A0A0H2RCF7_9AGAM|nr:hypothetical protein SCHPADRAFT_907956 [Schizopora paradoxa]